LREMGIAICAMGNPENQGIRYGLQALIPV